MARPGCAVGFQLGVGERMTLILAHGQDLILLMVLAAAAFMSIAVGASFIRAGATRDRQRGEILVWCGFGLVTGTILLWPLLTKLF